MSRLSITLLGAPAVERDGLPVTFPSRKALALLAILAVAPGPHSRPVLAATLWPEGDGPHSAGALRYTLAVLKRALGDGPLLVARDQVALDAGAATLDVALFRRAVAAARAHAHPAPDRCPACLAELERAAALYGGDLLAGFSLRDSPAFDEWQLSQRQQLQQELAFALELLAAAAVARADWGPAVDHARRWAALDPLHEPAQRLLLRALAWSGRRTAALRQYRACAALLARELGVEPAEETRQLYEAILSRRLASPPAPQEAPPPPSPAPPAPPPPLVAREAELRLLHQGLARAVAGQPGLLLVLGEAGSGKTALLQAFAREAAGAHPDLLVAAASCDAYTGVGDPLQPFRAVLGALVGAGEPDPSWASVVPAAGGRPASLAAALAVGPELIDALVASGGRRAAPPVERQALFGQYAAVLRRLAADGPLLLILDDLQWADAASAELLLALGRDPAPARVLIVGAYRPAELAAGTGAPRHPLEPVVNELLRARGEVRVDLDRAGEEAGRRLVDALLDSAPNCLDEPFRAALFARTGGHPLFTVELLRGLQERGDLVLDEAGRWAAGAAVDWALLPARVEGLIAERVARLDEGLREALQIAAVEGEVFSAETVAYVQAADERGVIRALSGELERRHRLVRALGVTSTGARGLARYRFRHALFQQYLYGRLDPVERAQLHGEVGAALEQLAGAEAEAFAVELARHFAEAGHAYKAARYLLLAGRRALQLTAGDEALAHFRRGLALLQLVPQSPERSRHELGLQVAIAAGLTQLRGQASPETADAFGQAHRLSVRSGGQRELFIALWGRKSVHDIRAEYAAALALTDQLEELAEAVDPSLLRPAVDSSRGATLLYMGDLAAARRHLERAAAAYDPRLHHDLALQHGTDIGLVANAWLAAALWEQGFPDQGRRQSAAALALARKLGQRYNEVYALTIGARAFQRGHEVASTRRWAEDALALIPAGQFAMFHALASAWHGWAVAAGGDVEGGLAEMRRGHEAIQATGARVSEAGMHVLFAGVQLRAGRREAALEALAAARAVAEETGSRLDLVEARRLRGELLAADDPAGAEASARQAIGLAASNGALLLELRATTTLAAILGRQGRADEAAALLAPCYGRFTEGFDAYDLRAARALLEALASPRAA